MSAEITSSDLDGVHQEEFVFNNSWKITTRKSRILQSKCTSPFICNKSKETQNCTPETLCKLCFFESQIKIPHLPDMTFANNLLKIQHIASECSIAFSSLPALIKVDVDRDPLKVAAAEGWLQARVGCQYAKNVKKSYDWTYTTDYKGDLMGDKWDIEETRERIDYASLSVKEEILFYDEIDLFEDELADNGVSKLTVKFRAMRSGFYILLRFFLRVDGVLVRINDTRIYHKVDANQFIREYTNRECTYDELSSHDPALLTDPNQLCSLIPIRSQQFHTLQLQTN